jgi:hypothetical protein
MCASCGHKDRKHTVLLEKKRFTYSDPDGPPETVEFHRFAECMGCESIKYVVTSKDWHGPDDDEGDTVVYPDAPGTTARRTPNITK